MTPKRKHILEETIAFWESQTTEKCCEEDAREIIDNIKGFFWTLAEWESRNDNGPKNHHSCKEVTDENGQSAVGD